MKIKKSNVILVILIILIIISAVLFTRTLIQYIKSYNNNIDNKYDNELSFSKSENNDNIIYVDEDSSIRIINEYDENMFKGHKSLVFFWASWCSHCQEEYEVVKTAISNYQNKGYTIYIVSHDYDELELAEFMKNNDLNYEVYFDKNRIIRKNINPEASSVPLTYILDENANLIASHDGPITLDELNKLLENNINTP